MMLFPWLWSAAQAVQWRDWSPGVFKTAKAENKLVLLHVGAIWCHWCHVMEHETYEDPAIEERLLRSFVTVKIDQDARPDLSQRYEDWGWPATVIFAPDGTELAKLRGYIPAGRMGAMLDAFVADPTPGPSAIPEAVPEVSDPALSAEQREALLSRWSGAWDEAEGGWGRITKALDGVSIELSFAMADETQIARALRTATLQRQLLDPVWGGAYQYSHGGVWTNPHFEKIVPTQADDLRAFALAYAQRREPADREAALSIVRYLEDFLWASGYQASQDADVVPGEHAAEYFALPDAERRAVGMPRIDPHRYARENGLLAAALADASGYLGGKDGERLLALSQRTAQWAIANRSLPRGGFSHDQKDNGGPWLADTLSMGEAFWALYTATAEPSWLARASDALRFIDRTFRSVERSGGYHASARAEGIPGLPPLRHREENARLARLAAYVARATGDSAFREVAEHAMALCVGLQQEGPAAPVLLADRILHTEPMHIVVVGARKDPSARALYDAARALPLVHRQLQWRAEPGDELWGGPERANERELWGTGGPERANERELWGTGGPERANEHALPAVDGPTAFVCGKGYCSPPVTDPTRLAQAAAR